MLRRAGIVFELHPYIAPAGATDGVDAANPTATAERFNFRIVEHRAFLCLGLKEGAD